MFSPNLRSLALLGAAALSGCEPASQSPTPITVDARSSLERSVVVPTADGGAVLQMGHLSELERLLAIAEWRTKNPGEYIMRISDARYPLSANWVQMMPSRVTTTNESSNTIILSNESFGGVDHGDR